MKISEEMTETFKDVEIGTIFSCGEVIDMVYAKFKRNKDSIIPSDFCYNRLNKTLPFEHAVHLFEYITSSTYKYLGVGFPYTGKVFRKPKGGIEVCVGEVVNGKAILYDNPR